MRLFRDPELELGVDSKLLRPVFRTGVELLVTGEESVKEAVDVNALEAAEDEDPPTRGDL